LNIQILNPVDYPGWDDLILASDQTSFFHTAGWARALSETYGYQPLYFTIISHGRLSGLMPVMEVKSFMTGKRGVSLPFTDICPPVAQDQETFDALRREATVVGRRKGWSYIEIRGGRNRLPDEPACAEHLVHTLDLNAGEAGVSAMFKPNIRRNIRRARKEGVTVRLEHSLASVAAYYRLHCRTRRHHGLPPQPWSFFKRLHEHVVVHGKGFVALAEFEGRRIAGAVFAHYRDQAIYKFGASDHRFQRMRPNNLVMWEAIRWCCGNGIRSFSFGRTEPENEGLLHFKRSWGAAEARLPYFQLNLSSNRFVLKIAGRTKSNAAFKAMPLPVLRLAGQLLYRHVG